MMDIQKAIENRRSIRRYSSEPIPKERIERILAAGIEAPSAKNRQPWKYVVVTDAAKHDMIGALKEGINREKQSPVMPNFTQFIPFAENTLKIMEQASCIIVIENALSRYDDIPQDQESFFYEMANLQSIGASIQNMCLMAQSLGLGSLWICDIFFAYTELCRFLHTENQIPAVLALGVPNEAPARRSRKPFEEVVSWMDNSL